MNRFRNICFAKATLACLLLWCAGANSAVSQIMCGTCALASSFPEANNQVYFAARMPKFTGQISAPRYSSLDSPASCRILEALESVSDFHFENMSLTDAANYLRERFEINVVVGNIKNTWLGPDRVSVTLNLRNATLSSLLSHLTGPSDLGWAIRNDAIEIGPATELKSALLVRVYEVTDLVQFAERDGTYRHDYDTLIDNIIAIIEPYSWDDVGGEGSIQGLPTNGRALLVVSSDYQTHGQIEELLNASRSRTGLPSVKDEQISIRDIESLPQAKSRRRISLNAPRPILHE